MVSIQGEYQGEGHCAATHGPSGQTLMTDLPKDNHGRGEAFSPTDLVATGLATCMVSIMSLAARSHGVELKGLRFKVSKEMSSAPPRRIVRLATEIWLPMRRDTLPAHVPALLEEAALTCPVHRSLAADVGKPVVFHWPD